jgi:hypothetical protein
MFVGSINADLRSILNAVERILAAQGLIDLHGNDVSLYSCAVGAYLSGQPFRVEV